MSPIVRCYLPLTPAQLVVLHRTRRLQESLTAFTAWTPSAGEGGREHDEEGEHAALQSAARHVLSRGGPVIVAAADLERSVLDGLEVSGSGSVAQVGSEVTLPRVAALHVGDDVLGQSLAAADDEEIELSWYDTTEVDHLVGLL